MLSQFSPTCLADWTVSREELDLRHLKIKSLRLKLRRSGFPSPKVVVALVGARVKTWEPDRRCCAQPALRSPSPRRGPASRARWPGKCLLPSLETQAYLPGVGGQREEEGGGQGEGGGGEEEQ